MPWRAWGTTFNELDLDAIRLLKDEEREEILRRLFAPDGELRFTRGRITMNANDYSRAWYSCSEKDGDFELAEFNIEHDKTNQIALIKMAQKHNPNLVFWVSPWSPPAWMKLNKDYCVVSSKFNDQPKEKDALLFGGDAEEIDPNEMAKCPGVKLYLGTFNTNRRGYIEQILDAPGMLDCIDGIGYQWEGRQAMEAFAAEGRYRRLHSICSESECGNGQMDWRAAEHTSWLIFQNMGNGADEWYNWNFILCDQGRSPCGWKQNALIRVASADRSYSYRPEYYAVRHFSQFVKPGAVQLAYSPWRDSTEAVCYRNPDGGIVVVATNWAKESKEVSFKVADREYCVTLKSHSFNTMVL